MTNMSDRLKHLCTYLTIISSSSPAYCGTHHCKVSPIDLVLGGAHNVILREVVVGVDPFLGRGRTSAVSLVISSCCWGRGLQLIIVVGGYIFVHAWDVAKECELWQLVQIFGYMTSNIMYFNFSTLFSSSLICSIETPLSLLQGLLFTKLTSPHLFIAPFLAMRPLAHPLLKNG